jgi:hypothetical protein
MLVTTGAICVNTPATKITTSESVVDAVLGDEAVLLNIQSGVYFGLNAVGTRIWELLVQGTTQEEIVDRLRNEYDAEPAQLRTDVEGFVQSLAAKGLTRNVNG